MERDERLFIDGTISRVKQLIARHIWAGIDEARLMAWQNQFEIRNAELLGACLLDGFIFRSRPQFEALLKSALTSFEILGNTGSSDNDILTALRKRKDSGIRLVPVIQLEKPPTKSGTYVLRRLVKSLQLYDRWAVWPQNLTSSPPATHTIILVDDFCGSGQQFNDFVQLTKFDEFMLERPDCKIYYIAAAAYVDGINKIQQKYQKIKVIPGEILGPEHHFFDGQMLSRIKTAGLINRLRTEYESIANEVGLGGKSIPTLGFENQALTYAFDHGTPNNTLPIYWYQNEQWSSLVDR